MFLKLSNSDGATGCYFIKSVYEYSAVCTQAEGGAIESFPETPQHWPKILTVTQKTTKQQQTTNAFIIICGLSKSTERQKIAPGESETGAKEAQEIKSALGITMFPKEFRFPLVKNLETSHFQAQGLSAAVLPV